MKNASKIRLDVFEKVTGNAKYSGDYTSRNAACKDTMAEVPSAKILKIDTSEAEKLKGVEKVITRKHIVSSAQPIRDFRAL